MPFALMPVCFSPATAKPYAGLWCGSISLQAGINDSIAGQTLIEK